MEKILDPFFSEKFYNIGDIGPGGGLIFYYDESGFTVQGYGNPGNTGYFPSYIAHYLEAAHTDISPTGEWWSAGAPPSFINGTDFVMGTGRLNTALILDKDPTAPAAMACRNYPGGGKTDWFLPNLEEIMELFINRNIFGNFQNSEYWTSFEEDTYTAFYHNFINGYQSNGSKSSPYLVRPIRAF